MLDTLQRIGAHRGLEKAKQNKINRRARGPKKGP